MQTTADIERLMFAIKHLRKCYYTSQDGGLSIDKDAVCTFMLSFEPQIVAGLDCLKDKLIRGME